MKWTEMTIYTSKEGIEVVSGILLSVGIDGFIVNDPDDLRLFAEENSDMWDLMDEDLYASFETEPSIKVYLEDSNEGKIFAINLLNEISKLREQNVNNVYGRLEISQDLIKEQDWANNWKAFFRPFDVGEKLAVCPSWETYENTGDRIVLSIDPGNSFGSGLHETTRLCLMALEEYVKEGLNVIDVGCGSGILSVAAAKLGADKVIGIDIDQSAVETSKQCAVQNGVEDKIEVFCGDLTEMIKEPADIVVGNLFAGIIVRMLADIARVLKDDGILITSGIVTDSLQDVIDGYNKYNLEIIRTTSIGDWHVVVGKKRK